MTSSGPLDLLVFGPHPDDLEIGAGGTIARHAAQGQQVTDVLLQNIRVIAMDQAASSNGQPVVSRTATLELTPLDAQKVALGQQLGQLSLVLRKPGVEQNIPSVETVSLDDLRYSYYSGQRPPVGAGAPAASPPAAVRQARVARITQPRRPAPRPAGPAPVVRPTNTVDVTRGTQTSTYEVGGYGL